MTGTPGETEGWPIDALRTFLLEMIAANEVRCVDRAAAQERARGLVVDALNTAERHASERLTAVEQVASARSDAQDKNRAALFAQLQEAQTAQATQAAQAVTALEHVVAARLDALRILIDTQAEKVVLALAAADRAVQKAETATEKRFEGVNEFRSQLADQAATFIPRAEAEQRVLAATEKVAALADRVTQLSSRMDLSQGQGQGAKENKAGIYAAIGAAGVIITIVVIVVNVLLA